MLANKFPKFKKGNVLSKVMLESLRDFPKELSNLQYYNYSDGIISGMDIKVEKNIIHIGKGLIKFNGIIYMSAEEVKLDARKYEGDYIIKIKFNKMEETQDFYNYSTEVIVNDEFEINENEFELGRFNLVKTATLRCEFLDFNDFKIGNNTFDLRYIKYADSEEEGTVYPVILKVFSKEMLSKENISNFDIAFCVQCLNSDRVNRELILKYISVGLKQEHKKLDNIGIYKGLNKILRNAGNAMSVEGDKMKSRTRGRMIVD